uniref:Uncharacterized protein n=1 Tax=Ananas comosus var. bracteatus TaxID=296719 RepID=A0A6V7PQ98_ANACO|nr:unnamed protein product [Ananas comosus var. bracteatus]
MDRMNMIYLFLPAAAAAAAAAISNLSSSSWKAGKVGREDSRRRRATRRGRRGGEDFLASARDHLDQFKNTTAERHWICLKNTVRRAKNTTFFDAEVVTENLSAVGLDRAKNLSVLYGTMRFFGPSKVGGESDTGANDTANSPGDPISLGFD